MIKFNIDKEVQDKLFDNILYENHHKTRLKNFVLYLKSLNFKHKDICQICRITKPTLTEYLTEFNEQGIESFTIKKWKGQFSKLNKYKELIDSDFEKNPPKSINEAQERIEKLTTIRRSPTQVRLFMKSLEYRYLKTGSIPGNGDGQDLVREETREEFKKKNLSHVWKKQKEEKE